MLAKLSLDFISIIDHGDKHENYVRGNEQSVPIWFLSPFCIHDKDYRIELDVNSNIHQLIWKMNRVCNINQQLVSELPVYYMLYLSLFVHYYSPYGCVVDMVDSLISWCAFNMLLIYLDVKEGFP